MPTKHEVSKRGAGRWLAWPLLAAILVSCTSDSTIPIESSADAQTITPAELTTTTPITSDEPVNPSTTTIVTGQTAAPIAVVTRDGIAGWWNGTEWQSAESVAIESLPLRGGEKYQLVHVGEPTIAAVGRAPDEGCEFNDFPGVPGLIPQTGDQWPASVPTAITGVAVPVSRPVTLSSGQPEAYKAAARELLAERGIIDPSPALAQVIITDLDGNGSDEVIVTAARWTSLLPAGTGDYSLTFIRSVVNEEVVTSVLAFSGVDGTGSEEDAFANSITAHVVGAVADMNGDGVMEFTIENMYYEGTWTEIYEFTAGTAPRMVLEVGCGV